MRLLKTALLMCCMSLPAGLMVQAGEVNPLPKKCVEKVVKHNAYSVAHWSMYVPLIPTVDNHLLGDPSTGVETRVDRVLHDYLWRKEKTAWLVIRFYKTQKVLDDIADGQPTPTLQGLSNNLIYMQPNGTCFVSPDNYSDLKEYSDTPAFAYTLAKYLTFMSLDGNTHPIPPDLDSLYKAMSVEQLKLPIDAAIQRLIKLEDGEEDVSAAASPPPQAYASEGKTADQQKTEMYIKAFQQLDKQYDEQFPKKP